MTSTYASWGTSQSLFWILEGCCKVAHELPSAQCSPERRPSNFGIGSCLQLGRGLRRLKVDPTPRPGRQLCHRVNLLLQIRGRRCGTVASSNIQVLCSRARVFLGSQAGSRHPCGDRNTAFELWTWPWFGEVMLTILCPILFPWHQVCRDVSQNGFRMLEFIVNCGQPGVSVQCCEAEGMSGMGDVDVEGSCGQAK